MLASAAIGVIAMGLGAAAAMALIQYITSRLPPKELAGDYGAMHPNDSMIAVAILIAAGVAGAAVFYHVMIAKSLVAIVIALLGVVSIPIMATAFSSIYDITWDNIRITGPRARTSGAITTPKAATEPESGGTGSTTGIRS